MRLNKAVREEITRNALKALRDRRDAMDKRETALAVLCYNVAVPKDIRDMLEACDRVTDKLWLDRALIVSFNVAGQHVRMRLAEAVVVPFRYQHYNGLGRAITMEKHEALVNKVRALQGDWETYKSDLALAERTMKSLLKTVGSTETLFKAWPEGKKFYATPPLTPQSKISVPAVQMQSLNTLLGLKAA
jgi:hypothetical protein